MVNSQTTKQDGCFILQYDIGSGVIKLHTCQVGKIHLHMHILYGADEGWTVTYLNTS